MYTEGRMGHKTEYGLEEQKKFLFGEFFKCLQNRNNPNNFDSSGVLKDDYYFELADIALELLNNDEISTSKDKLAMMFVLMEGMIYKSVLPESLKKHIE